MKTSCSPAPKWNLEVGAICRRLERELSPARFLHSLGVCHSMIFLCGLCGENRERGAAAGLLHDCARYDKKNPGASLGHEAGGVRASEDLAYPGIWHARDGARRLRKDFGIDAAELIEAVRIHPTGKAGMSLLARLLFIADFIEPTRDFPGVDSFRYKAYQNPARAFPEILKAKVEHIRTLGLPLHPDSLEALEYYSKED